MVEMSLTHVQFDPNAFEVLYRMSEKFLAFVSLISCMIGKVVMTHVLLEYHIKEKSGELLKLSQQLSCTVIVTC